MKALITGGRFGQSVGIAMILVSALVARGAVYYVNGSSGDDTHAGTGGWSDALKTLTNALEKASSGSEIWVTGGVYRPTENDDREMSFVMKDGVDLYGGFNGTESNRDERDWENSDTEILPMTGVACGYSNIKGGFIGDGNRAVDSAIKFFPEP